MKKCLHLIANTDTWKKYYDIILSDCEEKVIEYKVPIDIFGEKQVNYEKIIANNKFTDENIHCVVEMVDDNGKSVSMLDKII